MAIHLRQNQYRGVNAHLHSALQNEPGDWEMFHAAHIVDIAEALDAKLYPRYEVKLVRSLQLKEYHPDTGEPIKPPETDQRLQDDEAYLTAILIAEVGENGKRKVVTHIELLSPTSKVSDQAARYYRQQRRATLRDNAPLVEIDYLHESPSPLQELRHLYRRVGSHPYCITVDKPRSSKGGSIRVYSFDVDEPIPRINLPLADDEFLTFDLNPVYNQTFESLSYFTSRVDYEQVPVRFETYSEADQQRIRVRMAEVMQSHRDSSN